MRESVGGVNLSSALHMKNWPKEREVGFLDKGLKINQVLQYPVFTLTNDQTLAFKNGAFLKFSDLDGNSQGQYYWVEDELGQILGLAEKVDERFIKPKINFQTEIKSVS